MFFGMIKEEKGLDILIKSFHEVHKKQRRSSINCWKDYKTDIQSTQK